MVKKMTVSAKTRAEKNAAFKGVARRFAFALLAVLAVVILLFACLAIYLTVNDTEQKLGRTLNNHLNVSAVGLRSLIWNLDNDATEDVIEALFVEPEVIFVRVEADNATMAESVRPDFEGMTLSKIRAQESVLTGTEEITHPDSVRAIGTIEIGMSRQAIHNELLFEVSRIIVLTLSLMAAILVTTILVSRKYIAQPLRELQRSANLMAGGDLSAQIDASSRDEIGLLASDLNLMRDAIKHRNALLEDSNLNLENRVRERTEELAGAVAEIKELNEQLAQDNQRMSAELDITRRIQEMLLPTPNELSRIEALDIAAHMDPADEVGGDYYDVLAQGPEGAIKFSVGDVTGHGLESGMMAVMTQCALRTLFIHGEKDPIRFLDTLNKVLYDNVTRMQSDKNLTLAVVDYKDGHLTISGQHESILVVRADGPVEDIDTIDLGFPIALDRNVAQYFAHADVILEAGDGIVLYTDGVTEAENAEQLHYGVGRLSRVVQEHWSKSAEAVKQAVLDDLYSYIGQQTVYDDITLVVVKQR